MWIMILKPIIYTTISLIGLLGILGMIMSQIERWNNYYVQRTWGKAGVIVTGFIGTTIHELSHLVMCIVFRHKVKRVKLFRPIQGSKDGVLGFVSHTYNPKSTYQKIGNFFIGVAPIVIGTILIHMSLKYLLPECYHYLEAQLKSIYEVLNLEVIDFANVVQLLGETFVGLVMGLFVSDHWNLPHFYIFLILMYTISTHMSLSKADIKGSLSGVLTFYIALSIGSVLVYFLSKDFNVFLGIVLSVNIYIGLFMLIGIMFSLITLMISMILYGIKRAIVK